MAAMSNRIAGIVNLGIPILGGKGAQEDNHRQHRDRSQCQHRRQPPKCELRSSGVSVPYQPLVQTNAQIKLPVVLGPFFLQFIEFHIV
jgi:hypothetical protein